MSPTAAAVELTNGEEGTSTVVAELQNAKIYAPVRTPPKEVLYTFHGKHDHWMRFSRAAHTDHPVVSRAMECPTVPFMPLVSLLPLKWCIF
jgi:hypothetical protein